MALAPPSAMTIPFCVGEQAERPNTLIYARSFDDWLLEDSMREGGGGLLGHLEPFAGGLGHPGGARCPYLFVGVADLMRGVNFTLFGLGPDPPRGFASAH